MTGRHRSPGGQRTVVFAALPWECGSVVRQLRRVGRDRLGVFSRWRGEAGGREVWVVKTGIGIDRAAAAAAARAWHDVGVLVSTGCAGALAAELAPGDLAVATRVVRDDRAAAYATDATHRAGALRAAAAAGLRAVEGPILCSPVALVSAAAKRAAAGAGAIAVEMEAEPLAARAAAAQVPFLSVRAILDGAEHELDLPAGLMDAATGHVRPLTLAGYLAAHPSALADALAMQRLQRAARTSLERFFAEWLAG